MKKAAPNDSESPQDAQLRMQRFYEVFAKANHAIIHSKTSDELFERICAAAVNLRMCDAAWIGMLQDGGELLPVACAGTPIELVQAVKYHIGDPFLQANSVAVKAVLDGSPCLRNDYLNNLTDSRWADEMHRVGIRSSGALPIYRLGKIVGIFAIGDAPAEYFNEELNALLAELAESISFYLDTEMHEQA
jgi:GAF domain-containing protein